MSHHPERSSRMTIPDFQRKAAEGGRLVMTTAYDAVTAGIADAAGVDALLVGDSVGNVCLGFEDTLPVTLEMIAHHLGAVARSRPRALLLADLPFLSYHLGIEDTLRNAGAFIRLGAQGVKLEGGARRAPVVRALVEAEIPVMGHLGLTPQSVHAMGGYRVQAREAAAALQLLEDAQALQEAGCFAVVLEGIPAELGARVTESLKIPTIGIGAGPSCSGQVLVFHDVLGLGNGPSPKFVRRYMNGFEQMRAALAEWGQDVREGRFPGAAESYMLPDTARDAIRSWRAPGDPRT